MGSRELRVRIVAGFLAVSYAVGAPMAIFFELRDQALSQRFGYPSELILLTCAVQIAGAIGVLVRRLAPWAAAALTLITLGAIVSHLRVGHSPQAAVPALFYTVLQVWLGLRSRAPRPPG